MLWRIAAARVWLVSSRNCFINAVTFLLFCTLTLCVQQIPSTHVLKLPCIATLVNAVVIWSALLCACTTLAHTYQQNFSMWLEQGRRGEEGEAMTELDEEVALPSAARNAAAVPALGFEWYCACPFVRHTEEEEDRLFHPAVLLHLALYSTPLFWCMVRTDMQRTGCMIHTALLTIGVLVTLMYEVRKRQVHIKNTTRCLSLLETNGVQFSIDLVSEVLFNVDITIPIGVD